MFFAFDPGPLRWRFLRRWPRPLPQPGRRIVSMKKYDKNAYPLVNIYITMENHHFYWLNQLFLWAIFNSYVCLPKG